MIVQALIIILVILVIANFSVGFFNKVSPPCMDAAEYFDGGRRLPDGAVAGLGSIPTHTSFDYIGARRVPTGIPGTIGLTSWNKNGYIGNIDSSVEGYINPIVKEIAEDDASDCRDHLEKDVSQKASDAIDNIFQPNKKAKAEASKAPKGPSLTEHEVSFDAIESRKSSREGLTGRHMSLAHNTARDGYTSRPGDKI